MAAAFGLLAVASTSVVLATHTAGSDRTAYQRIYQDDDNNAYFTRSVDTKSRVVKLGCMIFHPQHHHWHYEGFARYDLKPIAADGAVRDTIASSVNVSFCITDTHRHGRLLGTPDNAYYTECGRNSTLGISVGWSDEYHSTLADQNIEITGVPDGDYCLASTVDPLGKIVEIDNTNNSAGVKIAISGNNVDPRTPSETCG